METRDVETGHDLLRQLYSDHTPRLSGNVEDYRFRYLANDLDSFGIDRMDHSLLVHADLEPYHLLLAVIMRHGRMTVSSGGATEQVGTGDLLLMAPHRPISYVLDNMDVLPVRLDRADTCAVAEDLTGVEATRVRFAMSRPLGPAQVRYWKRAVAHVTRNVLAHDELARQPLIRAEAFRLLASALITTFPNNALGALGERAAPGTFTATPAVLRRAVEFIDANAHRDIGLAEVARAARIGPRGLQHLFRRHRDQTPLEYLRRVRLEGAHGDLVLAVPGDGDTVAAIAARWGFAHAGRFAVEYRRVYGRSPGQTLRS
ncbi:hypothetical protein FRP1_24035 [Pseudonocardia sp. EC080625-04]|nr:hypothetical protein FRP1_24035 [Pseudonocardia sp. EC080625-04]